MNEEIKPQTCPYCNYEVEDHKSEWDADGNDAVKCENCNKIYGVKPQYAFEGWVIEKQCDKCEQWTEDSEWMCDCHDDEEEEEGKY